MTCEVSPFDEIHKFSESEYQYAHGNLISCPSSTHPELSGSIRYKFTVPPNYRFSININSNEGTILSLTDESYTKLVYQGNETIPARLAFNEPLTSKSSIGFISNLSGESKTYIVEVSGQPWDRFILNLNMAVLPPAESEPCTPKRLN